jgi:hypothetical protein
MSSVLQSVEDVRVRDRPRPIECPHQSARVRHALGAPGSCPTHYCTRSPGREARGGEPRRAKKRCARLSPGPRQQYPVDVEQSQLRGGGRDAPEEGGRRDWVASTSCLVVVIAVALVVLVMIPALIWGAGIACG